jgi:hypothetical protein
LEAHLKEFSEEGLVRNANIFHHDAGLIPDPLLLNTSHTLVSNLWFHSLHPPWFLGFNMNGGRDSLLLDMGTQVEDAVYITLRASESSCSDAAHVFPESPFGLQTS